MDNCIQQDIIGLIYCPLDFDNQRLSYGSDATQIQQIALDTCTDISYIHTKNAIQIAGDTQQDVFNAQNKLNNLFFPVALKSKKSWARPDRPGQWGQRRDAPTEKHHNYLDNNKRMSFNPKRKSMGFNPKRASLNSNSSGSSNGGQWANTPAYY
ncbi:hypothetical protein BC833DRAFT_591303 [Globomyces pollinis-pini]|nr:hypothetical protein BC833DRAFT_591303 [Globomyces pollinis-pini]